MRFIVLITAIAKTLAGVLEVAGLASIVAAAWRVDHRLGLLALGAALLLVGIALDRR